MGFASSAIGERKDRRLYAMSERRMEKGRPEDRLFRHPAEGALALGDLERLRQDHAQHGTGEAHLDRAGARFP
jgi:hypothetical protein